MVSRLLAFGVLLLVLASLRAQFNALLPPVADQDLATKLWFMAGYFTILTNVLIGLAMIAVVRKWQMSAAQAAGLLVSIVMVAIVYHLVLARLWSPTGLAWWADQGLHTAVPLATLLWWSVAAPKDVDLRDLPYWLIWPAAYGIYALIRGYATGFWAYGFLNGDTLGPWALSVNIAGFLLGFAVLGLVVLAVARRLRSA
ncbi:MAG: Pr6Pr family membrane protein [bacterium]